MKAFIVIAQFCTCEFLIHRLSEVKWNGKDIIVMDEVRIVPPYGPENCSGKEGHLLNHVKKIVCSKAIFAYLTLSIRGFGDRHSSVMEVILVL